LTFSTRDKELITIEFDRTHIYAQSLRDGDIYTTTDGIVQVPVEYSPTELVANTFYIFEHTGEGPSYLGDIEFLCASQEYYQMKFGSLVPRYLVLGRCSFGLPEANDTFTYMPKIQIPDHEKSQLWAEITAFRADAPDIFSRGYTAEEIAARCRLITQFIWSLDPPVYSSTAYVNMSLMNKIQGLRDNKIGMLCAGFRDLFIDIASVVMPDVALRGVNAFRWNDAKTTHITVHSHALAEVACEGGWWLFDPTFRLYFTNNSGDPANAHEIRKFKDQGRLDQINIIHIPTPKPPVDFFDDPDYAADLSNPNYWCYFKWLKYRLY